MKSRQSRTFFIHASALLAMLTSAALLYPAAQAKSQTLETGLLLVFALANLLIILV